jgi:hypothetical protein
MDIADTPLCEGDAVLVDLWPFGLNLRGVRGRLLHSPSSDCSLVTIQWDDDLHRHREWHGEQWRVPRGCVVGIVAGLAPTVPDVVDVPITRGGYKGVLGRM